MKLKTWIHLDLNQKCSTRRTGNSSEVAERVYTLAATVSTFKLKIFTDPSHDRFAIVMSDSEVKAAMRSVWPVSAVSDSSVSTI